MTGRLAALFAPIVKTAKLAAWPVGSIYMSMVATNPGTLFGGTWERIAYGRMLIGADSITYPAGSTGGEATHKLTTSEMPGHSHPLYGNAFLWGVKSGLNTPIYIPGMNAALGYTQENELSTDESVYRNAKSAGSSVAHNNMPPYLSVYMWRRTA
mgnify:FL=1